MDSDKKEDGQQQRTLPENSSSNQESSKSINIYQA